MKNQLVHFNKARNALIKASTIDEIKDVRDKAEALRLYTKQQGESLEMQNQCAEIKIRAERKAGELLKKIIKHSGGRPKKNSDTVSPLSDIGITKKQSSRWQQEASVSEKEFETYVEDCKEKKEEITSIGLRKIAQNKEIKKRARDIKENPPEIPKGKFSVIYADPPWKYEHSKTDSRMIENQYPTMELDDICGMAIEEISADDCILFMWTTSPKLKESFKVLNAWAFTYKTCAVWDKEKIGMGYYFRQQHELLLIATRGKIGVPEPHNRPSSIIKSPRGKHSKKPDIVYKIIEAMYPNNKKIELFCRKPQKGWKSYGNEIA